MERLPYTGRKTSGKTIKKGKFSVNLDLYTIVKYAKDVAIGVLMGIGAFMVLITTFGLRWHRADWPNGTFSDGMVAAWNIVAHHLAAVDGVFLKQLVNYDPETGRFLFIVLLFSVIVGVLISLSRKRWFLILYVLLVGLPSVIWGVHPSVLAVAILAGGVLLFIINSDIHDLAKGARGLIYGVLIGALSFVLMCVPAISGLADRPQALDNYRENVQAEAVNSYYGENPLHDGDLTVKKRKTGNGTALKVTMSTPDSIYLRGFVGDVLKDDGWEPLSYATYYDDRDLFFWLRQNGFNGLGQISQSAELAGRGGEINNITIENIGANKRYAYVPYEISFDGVSETKNWGESFLTGGKLHRIKEYSFTTSTNLVSDWTNIASQFYTKKHPLPEQAEYITNESHYNAYIYKKFTYLSKDDREVLDVAMGDGSGDQKRGHVEYNAAIKQIRQLLATNFVYEDTLTGYKKKYTIMENIFSAQSGYDAQFATAAVMMFRYYGIPARYVEGYLITQSDVSMGQTSIDVPRSNAHAWAEIYIDGIGFVPVEVCPNYLGLMKEADYNVGITTKSKKPLMDKSKQNGEDPNVVIEKTKTNAGSKKMPHFPVVVLAILAAMGILAILVFLVVKLIRAIKKIRARRKLFRKGEPREAVRAIYHRMDEVGIEPTERAADIGNKASYSEIKVYEEDRQFMLEELKSSKKRKQQKQQKKEKPKKEKTKKQSKQPKQPKDAEDTIDSKESKLSKLSKLPKLPKLKKQDKQEKGIKEKRKRRKEK